MIYMAALNFFYLQFNVFKHSWVFIIITHCLFQIIGYIINFHQCLLKYLICRFCIYYIVKYSSRFYMTYFLTFHMIYLYFLHIYKCLSLILFCILFSVIYFVHSSDQYKKVFLSSSYVL